MNCRVLLRVAVVAISLFGVVDFSWAVLPDDRIVQFDIHETPSDPQTAVEFSVYLDLQAKSTSGDDVAWKVTRVRIERFSGVQRTDLWTDLAPAVDTPDGYWWVTHSDPSAPDPAEFVVPPYIFGECGECGAINPGVTYDIEGAPYIAPPGGSPYLTTGSLDFSFTMEGETTPVKEGNDDPVELPDEPLGPTCA